MTIPKPMMPAVQQPPASGQSDAGVPFDPVARRPKQGDATIAESPHDGAMPAPQSPLSVDEMERLKARAAINHASVPGPGQHDPSVKKLPK
jgi:hypothetical protein